MAEERKPGRFSERFSGRQDDSKALPQPGQAPSLPAEPEDTTKEVARRGETGISAVPGTEFLLQQLREKYRHRQGAQRQAGPQTTSRTRFSRTVRRIEFQEVVVYFLVDATSSMQRLIESTAVAVARIIGHVYERAPEGSRLKARVVFFRDYCDGEDIIQMSPVSSDPKELTTWALAGKAYGGGDIPEAIEYALEVILGEHVRPTMMFLFGDAPGHEKLHIPQNFRGEQLTGRTSREIAEEYGKVGIPIHTIAVIQRPDVIENFQAIAQASGGVSGFMHDQDAEAMTTMVTTGILNAVADSTTVLEFLEHRALPEGTQQFIRGLLQ